MLEIESLYARYGRTISDGDAAAWAACFTDDGVFSNARGRHEGSGLQPYAEGWIRDGGVRYWVSNLVVDAESAGRAHGSCYLAIIGTGNGQSRPRIQLTGLYTDQLTRRDGTWKFASRHIARDL